MTGFGIGFCHAGITQVEFCRTSFSVYVEYEWNRCGYVVVSSQSLIICQVVAQKRMWFYYNTSREIDHTLKIIKK